MSKKTTKRALAMSFVSVFLCVCMLVGTTFAWFTDSVSSSGNKIQAGTLDIDLYQLTGNDAWSEISNSTAPLFSYDKWEPGYTAYQVLKVTNNGSLALKWTATLTHTGTLTDLAKVIDVYVTTTQITTLPTKTAVLGWTKVGTLDQFIAGFDAATKGELTASAEAYLGIALHMQETAGNDYQGLDLGGTFDIQIVATQLAYESDSFDNQYDVNAEYPNLVKNAAELADALANGKDAVLSNDIVDAPVNTKAPYGNYYGVALNGGVLDGNGNSLDFNKGELNNGKLDNYGIMVSAGTIKNVDITGVFRGIVIMNPTDDIYIDNVTIGGEDVCYAINTAEGDGTHSLIVTNSTLAGWTSYSNIASASFTNVKFEQGTYYNNIYGRVLKPYVNTTLTNCSFIEHMNLDLSSLAEGQKVTFVNCTVNGQAVTADVFTIPTEDAQYDTDLFTIDLPSWATSIADCIVFN